MIDLKIPELITIARQQYPQEACGFLLQTGEIYQCQNSSFEPDEEALISAEDYAAASAIGILAIYHSHTKAEQIRFSDADAKAAQFHKLPIVMINAVNGQWQVADPIGTLNLPYEGRAWLYGIHDCYALVRDYLQRELGVSLPDWVRGDESEWRSRDFNPFVQNYAELGFKRLPPNADLQHGDLLLIAEGTYNPSHLGVVCDIEQGCFLHHLANQDSRKDIWGGYWAKKCFGILRYECGNG